MNGIVGLETSLPLSLKLVSDGVLTLAQLVEKMSCNPSKILSLGRGTLVVGAIADITVIDPAMEWVVDADKLASKSKNSPFIGWKMLGGARCVIVAGKVVDSRS
jgi:dihydroorotase